MRLYLAMSRWDGWGGVKLTVESLMKLYLSVSLRAWIVEGFQMVKEKDMKIHLASYQPGNGDSKNPATRFVGGTDQWKCFGKLSEKENMKTQNLNLRILLSYWYYKDQDLDKLFAKYFTKPYPDVFADSGAFSAFTQGVEIDIAEYAAWVQKWKHLFITYANLDVIGDGKGTYKNQQILEGTYGLKPLPVFHSNEDWKWLKRYLKTYQYIALGGLGSRDASVARLFPWVIRAFRMAKDTNAVYHGFAVTSWRMLKALPWYSVDSSSWGSGFRFGRMPIFDNIKGEFIAVDLGNTKSCYAARGVLDRLGFKWTDFADKARYDRAQVCGISALSYMLAEQWLRRRHGKVSIYLADTNMQNLHDADTSSRKGVCV